MLTAAGVGTGVIMEAEYRLEADFNMEAGSVAGGGEGGGVHVMHVMRLQRAGCPLPACTARLFTEPVVQVYASRRWSREKVSDGVFREVCRGQGRLARGSGCSWSCSRARGWIQCIDRDDGEGSPSACSSGECLSVLER